MVVNEGVQLSIVGDSELHFTIKETEQPAQLGEAAMRAALEMAKKEIRHLASVGKLSIQCGVLEAIDEVLQSEASDQEPVALTEAVAIVLEGFNIPSDVRKILETAYYTRPTEFKTLTDDEIEYMWEILGDVEAFARAIEQELKDKNGY
jgi:tRNA G37 N-methylase TrmD